MGLIDYFIITFYLNSKKCIYYLWIKISSFPFIYNNFCFFNCKRFLVGTFWKKCINWIRNAKWRITYNSKWTREIKDQDIHYLYCKKIFKLQKQEECELRITKKDETTFWVLLTAIEEINVNKEPMYLIQQQNIM